MKFRLFLIIFLVFLVSFFVWQGMYLPKDLASTENKLFSVERGQNIFKIAENLEKEGLIKNKFLFDFYVITKGMSKKLQAGEYYLSPSMSIIGITKKIISGEVAKIEVTIPEGFTIKQIEERLNLNLPGADLEGFLFPDTYQFSYGVSAEEIIRKMLDNFDKKLSPYRNEISGAGLTLFDVITMASLLEKEVKTKEEKEIVSGIFWKRIKGGIPLDSCATIAYILGGGNWSFEEMRKEIAKGKEIDSPYNTYKYLGLPLGPICNPGLESILASIYSKDSEYWYYLSTPEGETIFSKTLEEHNIAQAKYLK